MKWQRVLIAYKRKISKINCTNAIRVDAKDKIENSNDIYSALKKISNKKNKTIVFFGSFYLAGNVLSKN